LRDGRLVTLTGAGGVGKTRTAVAVAAALSEEFRDGVWLTELAPVALAQRVVASIAQAVGVEQLPENRALESLIARLKRRSLLLVLDNCEHLVAPAAVVVDALLRGCPDVRILATSREALMVAGERIFLVPSLQLPAPKMIGTLRAAEAGGYAAIALFVERARQAGRHFALTDANAPLVADICRRLDGIPLAIELAAARANVLSLDALAGMLDERFTILAGGRRTALPRQQTMRALFDWSYDLLKPAERTLFARLAVFAPGFTVELAGAVCATDPGDERGTFELLSSLVAKSLVGADFEAAQPRFTLSESAREYALERLIEAGERSGIERKHALAYADLAEHLERIRGTIPESAWLAQTLSSVENWRAALDWSLTMHGDAVIGQRLAAALRVFFGLVSLAEGRRWSLAAAALIDECTPRPIAAKVSYAEAQFAIALFDYEAALSAAERALALYGSLDAGIEPALLHAIAGKSLVHLERRAAGEERLLQALAAVRALGHPRSLAHVLATNGSVARWLGDASTARANYSEAHAIWKSIGIESEAGLLAGHLAEIEFQSGDAQAAVDLNVEALAVQRALGYPYNVVACLLNMAAYLIALGQFDEAYAAAREAIELIRELQIDRLLPFAVQRMAAIAALQPQDDPARSLAAKRRAAGLMGFVTAHTKPSEISGDYTERQEYERFASAVSAELEPAELTHLIRLGARMSEDQAVHEALGHGVAHA